VSRGLSFLKNIYNFKLIIIAICGADVPAEKMMITPSLYSQNLIEN
jgi:hypothetical protein